MPVAGGAVRASVVVDEDDGAAGVDVDVVVEPDEVDVGGATVVRA